MTKLSALSFKAVMITADVEDGIKERGNLVRSDSAVVALPTYCIILRWLAFPYLFCLSPWADSQCGAWSTKRQKN